MTPEPTIEAGRGSPDALPFTLQMYAEECSSPLMARALRSLGRRLEQGETWAAAVQAQRGLPRYLRGAFQMIGRGGRLDVLLSEYLGILQRNRRTRRRALGVIVYPTLVLLAAMSICGATIAVLMPAFVSAYNDFGIELPALTLLLITLGDFVLQFWPWLALGLGLLFLSLTGVLLLARTPAGAEFARLLQLIPIVGTTFWMAGASEFCSLLAILMDARVPLPEALRLTSQALHDPSLRVNAAKLADSVEAGAPPGDAALGLPGFRSALVQAVRVTSHGDKSAALLRAQSEMFALQAEFQARIAILWVEPFLIVTVGMFLGLVIFALFMPMVKLLGALS